MLKKICVSLIFLIIGFSFFSENIYCDGSNGFLGENRINNDLKGSEKKLDVVVSGYVIYILSFLLILATVYGLYGGFLIFTAGDSDDRSKKGRDIIFQVMIGMVVIFLAGLIANFIIGLLGENRVDR